MPEPLLFLKAMGAAAIASAICILAMARVRPGVGTTWLDSACVLGLALGLASGYGVLGFRWTWPPVNGLDRLLTLVVPATLGIELLAGFPGPPRNVAWLLRIGLAAATPRVLLHDSVYLGGTEHSWTTWQAGLVLAACGLLLAAAWMLLAWLGQRSGGVSIPISLGMAAQCTGVTVMMAGYLKGGSATFPLVGAVASSAIAGWLVTRRYGTLEPFRSTALIGVGVVGLFGLLFIGRFFGRLSTEHALAMLVAPLLCWATELPPLRRLKPWFLASLRLLLVAIPLLIVLVLAKRGFDQNMAPLLRTPVSSRRARDGHPATSAYKRSGGQGPLRGKFLEIPRGQRPCPVAWHVMLFPQVYDDIV